MATQLETKLGSLIQGLVTKLTPWLLPAGGAAGEIPTRSEDNQSVIWQAPTEADLSDYYTQEQSDARFARLVDDPDAPSDPDDPNSGSEASEADNLIVTVDLEADLAITALETAELSSTLAIKSLTTAEL